MNRELLLDIFRAGVAAVDPYRAVARALAVDGVRLSVPGEVYDLDRFERVLVVGAGKASARMAQAAGDLLGDRIRAGIIITKYGHGLPLGRFEQVEASHPLPDSAGLAGTKKIVDLVRTANERTLVVCLLSGGGSSLLVLPLPGITLEQKQKTTELLLKAGASIRELNAVRKHLSGVKGGRLAAAAFPASVLTLALSDVIGDPLDVIASGPTAPDGSTFADAAAVLHRYGLEKIVPGPVAALIGRGARGEAEESAKEDDACFQRTRNVIVGGLGIAVSAASRAADSLGCPCRIVTQELQGEAREAANMLARIALDERGRLRPGERRCLLAGGETTVTVRGDGRGGRNQELALAFALAVGGVPGISLLSGGTDGTDGPTDAAGAVVDGGTISRARSAGIDPEDHLARNDSYSFFERLDALTGSACHLKTGPTGTNVMDLQIVCIERTTEAEQ